MPGKCCRLATAVAFVPVGCSFAELLVLPCSDSWVAEFKKAADSVATNANAKSAVSSAFSSISKLSSSAQRGDSSGAKQAFVGAVSSLQSWASGSGLQVKGL